MLCQQLLHLFSHNIGHFFRLLSYFDPNGFKGFNLFGSRALAALDDGSGVAHSFAGRGGTAGNKGRDRFGHLFPDKLGGFLLVSAANFADENHLVGQGITFEELQNIDKRAADDGITADPDAGRLPQTGFSNLIYSFIR